MGRWKCSRGKEHNWNSGSVAEGKKTTHTRKWDDGSVAEEKNTTGTTGEYQRKRTQLEQWKCSRGRDKNKNNSSGTGGRNTVIMAGERNKVRTFAGGRKVRNTR